MGTLASKLPLSLRLVTLLLATGALYWQDLTAITREAMSSELANYMLAIPFLSAVLVFVKRKNVAAAISFQGTRKLRLPASLDSIIGGLILLGAVLVYWYGSYSFYPLEYHLLSLPLFLSGLVLLLFNIETLRSQSLPLLLLLFLQPLPLEFALALGSDLAILSAQLSYTALRAIGQPLELISVSGAPVFSGRTVTGEPLFFAVSVACSGIYSLVGFTSFAFFAGSIVRGRLRSKLALLLLGFPIVYGLNILRIIIVTRIGYWYGEELATQTFHLIGGSVLIFLGVIVILLVGEKAFRVRIVSRSESSACAHSSIISSGLKACAKCGTVLGNVRKLSIRTGIPKLLGIALLVILLVNIQVPVFALTSGPAEISLNSLVGPQGSQTLLPSRAGWETKFVLRDSRFEKVSGQEASLLYSYSSQTLRGATVYTSVEIGTSRVSIHGWFESLVIWRQRFGRPTVTVLEYRDVEIWQNPPIVGKFFAFNPIGSNITQAVLYWIESSQFKVGQNFESRLVKTSLTVFPQVLERTGFLSDSADLQTVQASLLEFARDIVAYWSPAKTWSLAALALAKAGGILAFVVLSAAAALYGMLKIEDYRARRANRRLFSRIESPEERALLQAVAESKHGTGNEIMQNYEKLTGKNIDEEKMRQLITYATEAGLVKATLSKDDSPRLCFSCTFNPK